MRSKFKDKELHCNFCGREESEAMILVTGLEAHICEACVEQAQNIIVQELYNNNADAAPKSKKNQLTKKGYKLPNATTPAVLKAHLDNYIIGQDDAKKVMAVAVYNHYKRLAQLGKESENDVEIEKSNILFVGRTGTGKTLLAKTIAKFLNVPFAIVDATVFTEAGYVGEDVESILARLLQNCEYDVQAAELGIVYIDEVDKIARKGDNPSLTRDVSGEGVQQGLLKMLEGSEVSVPPYGGRKHPEQKMLKVNTGNILFICGGAFDGIERHIARRMNTQVIGYSNEGKKQIDRENLLQYMTHQDIKSFGLIPELLGRLPILTHLEPLDATALKRILSEPKNAILKQYMRMFELEGVKLTVSDEALEYIAEIALEYNLGARGLRSICETIMTDAMFEMPSNRHQKEFNIDLDYARAKIERSKFSVMGKAA